MYGIIRFRKCYLFFFISMTMCQDITLPIGVLMNTLIVNVFGEPSAGKSTAATYIFSQLKMQGISAEYVSEFAKDKVWENNNEVFKFQTYMFGRQNFKLARVNGKVDVVVTDSPIILSMIYNPNPLIQKELNALIMKVFSLYNNYNILLIRKHSYENNGRHENENEARKVRDKIVKTCIDNDIPLQLCETNILAYDKIIKDIINQIHNNKERKD